MGTRAKQKGPRCEREPLGKQFETILRSYLKSAVVFLAVSGFISSLVAESLIRRWGLIHA